MGTTRQANPEAHVLSLNESCFLQEIAEGKLTVGDLVLFLSLMGQLYGYGFSIKDAKQQSYQAAVSLTREVFSFVDAIPEFEASIRKILL